MVEDDRQAATGGDPSGGALDLTGLAVLSVADIEAAEDEGFLEGNQEYLDLTCLGVADLTDCIARENHLLRQFHEAEDTGAAERAFMASRKVQDDVEALWHLDVGVASATVALIASGAHPFLSCNGGVLGAHHSRPHPLVRFYLQDLAPNQLLDWVTRSGLSVANEEGILMLHSERLEPFLIFAKLVLSAADR
ncbi:MAG: hypothetical protein V4707_03075 [Pseudomonadota bacterium]